MYTSLDLSITMYYKMGSFEPVEVMDYIIDFLDC